jgi:CRP-like cAMP-binding protein
VFGRGEIIGDAEAIMNINHFCTVQTLTPCSFLKIGSDQFLNLLGELPAFNLLVHQSTTFKLLNTSQKVSIQSTNKLYYSLLLILRELAGFTDLVISKSLLTEFLGTSLRNINRLLPPLAHKNIIKMQSAIITHIQPDSLEKEIKSYERSIQ